MRMKLKLIKVFKSRMKQIKSLLKIRNLSREISRKWYYRFSWSNGNERKPVRYTATAAAAVGLLLLLQLVAPSLES